MGERIAILTGGKADDAVAAKTAVALLRYRREEVVAVIDAAFVGRDLSTWMPLEHAPPVVASVRDAAALGVDAIYLGVATAGGKLPPELRPAILEAAKRGLKVVSGMHDRMGMDAEIAAAAAKSGAVLVDLRAEALSERTVATGAPVGGAYRVATIGNDCSVGKMVAAWELTRGLQDAGVESAFAATGQTGMMLAGGGVPIDAVVGDFLNGAAEALVSRCAHHEVTVIEGQASVLHPSYSAVTMGLLQGSQPDALVLCCEPGRPHLHGRPGASVPEPEAVVELALAVARASHPNLACELIAVAMNPRRLADARQKSAAAVELERRLGVPVGDPMSQAGVATLVEAVRKSADRGRISPK